MKKYSTEDAAVIDANKSINKAYTIGSEIIEKLDDSNDWLLITKITKEGILIIYDSLFEFVYPDDDSWKRKRFETKTKKLREMKILNDVYEQDLLAINAIRTECHHGLDIDEKKIRGILHNTHSYKYNKKTVSKLSLQRQYLHVALKAITILKKQQGSFVTSYLNFLLGWQGSYYNFHVQIEENKKRGKS